MVIPRAVISNLTKKLNLLSSATRKVVIDRVKTIEYTSIADLRNKLIEALEPLFEASTDDAAAYAAEFYETIYQMVIPGGDYKARAVSMRNPDATEEAIRAIIQKMVISGELDSIFNDLMNRVDYEIKRAAGNCVIENSRLDPRSRKWARVPTGAETCTFCLMLASRGFVYSSAQTAGSDGHYHPNCDCRIVPGFDGMYVEGYDPDALYEEWKNKILE